MVYSGNNGFNLQSRSGGFLDADFPDKNQGVSGTPVAVHSGVLPNIRQVQNHLPNPSIYFFSHCNFLSTLCCFFPCSFALGAVTMVTGILGGCGGTMLSRVFRDKVPYVDPLICAAGLLGSIPCFLVSIFVAPASIAATYVRQKPSILAGLIA